MSLCQLYLSLMCGLCLGSGPPFSKDKHLGSDSSWQNSNVGLASLLPYPLNDIGYGARCLVISSVLHASSYLSLYIPQKDSGLIQIQ